MVKYTLAEICKEHTIQNILQDRFHTSDFSVLDQKGKKTRGCQIKSSKSSTAGECSLTNAYSKQFLISAAKKDDLLSLCESGVIPLAYHDFFQRLSSSKNMLDSIPEPAVEDNGIDDDD